jgi:hypothetical protein
MKARRDLAVGDDSPGLARDNRLAAMQAVGRRPVDQPVGDPVVDAAALGLKMRDNVRLGGLDELDDLLGRLAVGREQQARAGRVEREADAC